MTIALATSSGFPDLDADDAPLLLSLASRGVHAVPVVWDAPDVDWSRYSHVVIRSTWDYFHHRPRFLAWAEQVASLTTLVNSLALVRWNTHKRYLRELEARGIAVVPTAWIDARTPCNLQGLIAACGWHEAVLKPAVSGGAFDTIRVYRDGRAEAQPRLDAMLARGDAMIQPYLRSVEESGERSLIFFEGQFSHAIRKHAVLAGVLAGAVAEAETHRAAAPRVIPTDAELAFAARVLAATPEPPLYARVDLARLDHPTGDSDGLVLMELELVEPSLFLRQAPEAADRFADILARLTRSAHSSAEAPRAV